MCALVTRAGEFVHFLGEEAQERARKEKRKSLILAVNKGNLQPYHVLDESNNK